MLDGTGRPAYRADVGVTAGRITRIGDLSRATATTVIDASGLVVAPGFINIHSHACRASSTAANMLHQGVTTEILNSRRRRAARHRAQLVGAESVSASP